MSTALAVIETIPSTELFAPGRIDPILERIKAEVRATPVDISTESGRKGCASLAYKVAKSKTYLDGLRKQLVSDEKKRIAGIDAEGRRIWDELEALQAEVRKPLTDWENAEKDRVAAHERQLAALIEVGTVRLTISAAAAAQRLLEVDHIFGRDWEEFGKRAQSAKADAVAALTDAKLDAERMEEQQRELERLREEARARDQREREERIAAEARAAAEREAQEREEKAAAEAKAREERLAEQAREREAAAERERHEAVLRAEAAERAQREAVARAESEAQEAVAAERQRIEEQQRREAEETAARERDAAHKRKVHSDAAAVLVVVGITPEQAKQVVQLIAAGKVPCVKVAY